jgi:nicotinate-nucleotide pyrophosphorylase (carboxylating)
MELIKAFLKEDLGYGDITSEALIPESQRARARLYYREPGVIAGLEESTILFRLLQCDVVSQARDGDITEPEETLLIVEGPARNILAGERTALNIVGRMGGIATAARRIQEKVSKTYPKVRVAATRKTVPGFRELDKKAVEIGGADTHRFRLDDCVLIKDNHLALSASISEAVKSARQKVSFTKKIEVEVHDMEGAREAARAGADIIMFDNMMPGKIKECLKQLELERLRAGRLFEASGNITLDNAEEYASTGVDVISMGWLTHSVHSLNVKLKVEMM